MAAEAKAVNFGAASLPEKIESAARTPLMDTTDGVAKSALEGGGNAPASSAVPLADVAAPAATSSAPGAEGVSGTLGSGRTAAVGAAVLGTSAAATAKGGQTAGDGTPAAEGAPPIKTGAREGVNTVKGRLFNEEAVKNALEALLKALPDTSSVQHAGEDLTGKTLPALARQWDALYDQLGEKYFASYSKGFLATPGGVEVLSLYLDAARQLVQAAKKLLVCQMLLKENKTPENEQNEFKAFSSLGEAEAKYREAYKGLEIFNVFPKWDEAPEGKGTEAERSREEDPLSINRNVWNNVLRARFFAERDDMANWWFVSVEKPVQGSAKMEEFQAFKKGQNDLVKAAAAWVVATLRHKIAPDEKTELAKEEARAKVEAARSNYEAANEAWDQSYDPSPRARESAIRHATTGGQAAVVTPAAAASSKHDATQAEAAKFRARSDALKKEMGWMRWIASGISSAFWSVIAWFQRLIFG